MEQDASHVQAKIALSQGDVELAAKMASRCLALCSLWGMKLRLTSSLVLMGRVFKARGDIKEAFEVLGHATQLAEQQGYQVQIEHAERVLMDLRQATG